MKKTAQTLYILSAAAVAATASASVPIAGTVPTLGTAGWISLAVLLVGAGFVALRRRPPK